MATTTKIINWLTLVERDKVHENPGRPNEHLAYEFSCKNFYERDDHNAFEEEDGPPV